MATRPRPQLQIRLADDSFVFPVRLPGISDTIAACYAPDLHLLGTAREIENGAMRIESIGDWFERVKILVQQVIGVTSGTENGLSIIMNGVSGTNGISSGGAIGLLNSKYGTTYELRKLSGSSGEGFTFDAENKFRPYWWAVQNVLQYGAQVVVGFKGNGWTGSLGINPSGNLVTNPVTTASDFASTAYEYDIIFQPFHSDAGWTGDTYDEPQDRTDVVTIVHALKTSEAPVIGIVNAGITGTLESKNIDAPSNNEFLISTAGFKNHLNATASIGTSALIQTPLCVDLAGIICRNDEINYPWISPAGPRKGQVLNSVSLTKKLSPAEQDALYSEGVNPIVTVKGSGTFLFGDITHAVSTSTLVSINVVRTIIEIKRRLLPLAQDILFDNNTPDTRERFKSLADSALLRIQSLGGLTEYSIVCDETNNPPQVIDSKSFVADIRVKVPGSINYITVTLTNT
jgi:hypothetical protein